MTSINSFIHIWLLGGLHEMVQRWGSPYLLILFLLYLMIQVGDCQDNCYNVGLSICQSEVWRCRFPPNWICDCVDGYYVTNTNKCTDINECFSSVNRCGPNTNCTNTIGSYRCPCRTGYGYLGTGCQDIDECLSLSNRCGPNTNCTNTIGSYRCSCRTGYGYLGTGCQDINECESETVCHFDATCQNYAGGFNCTCKEGFHGDGHNCTDINECQSETVCHFDATCQNFVGGFNCTCKQGFHGDGHNCTETTTESLSKLNSLPVGMKIGLAVGAILLLALVITLAIFIWIKRKRANKLEESVGNANDDALPSLYMNVGRVNSIPSGEVTPNYTAEDPDLYSNNLIPGRKILQKQNDSEENKIFKGTDEVTYYNTSVDNVRIIHTRPQSPAHSSNHSTSHSVTTPTPNDKVDDSAGSNNASAYDHLKSQTIIPSQPDPIVVDDTYNTINNW